MVLASCGEKRRIRPRQMALKHSTDRSSWRLPCYQLFYVQCLANRFNLHFLPGFSCCQYRTDSTDHWTGKPAFVLKDLVESRYYCKKLPPTPPGHLAVASLYWQSGEQLYLSLTTDTALREGSRVSHETPSNIFFQSVQPGWAESGRWCRHNHPMTGTEENSVRLVSSRNTNCEAVTATLPTDTGQKTQPHVSLCLHNHFTVKLDPSGSRRFKRHLKKPGKMTPWLSR